MTAVSNIALSGLAAAQTSLAAAGHNIANTMTPGFRREVVLQQAQPGGGTTARLQTAAVEGDALADDLVGLQQAKHSFFANLAVFKTADAMTGSLLDAVG
jgi:flagellar hook protein FlgE